MRKFSVAVVCGLASMTFAGASSAQTSSDLSSAATANSLSSHTSSLSASSKNSIKLNTAATETDLFANAMKRTSGGTSAALKSAGTGSDVMNGKLAKAPAGPASAEDKLFKNALPAGGSVSNALKANTSGSNDTSGSVNAFAGAALLGPANVGNALGAERSNVTNQRLGK